MFKKTTSTLAIAGLAFAGITIASPTFAVENETIQSLTESTLENLGVENVSPELVEEISNNITDTINNETTDGTTTEIINPEIIETIDNGEVVPPEILDENLDEQNKLWDTVKSDWLEAFEAVRADFEECVAAATNASECAAGLGFKLQIAHGEAMLKNYDQRLAEIATLPEEEQAAALEKLEQHRQRTLERLEKANQRLADNLANGTPLPEGVRIKDIAGEAELVNGLLAELGSSEKAIPADAKKIQRNADGTVAIERSNGETTTVAPRKPNNGTPPVQGRESEQIMPNDVTTNNNQSSPRPQQNVQPPTPNQQQQVPSQSSGKPAPQGKNEAPQPQQGEQRGGQRGGQMTPNEMANAGKGMNTNG